MTIDRKGHAAGTISTASTASVGPAHVKFGLAERGLGYLLFIVVALALIAVVARHLRIPIRHRWRRRQAHTMSSQLRGKDRLQPPAIVFARLRAMDPLAFEELLLECFERRGHKVVHNQRYTGDSGFDGQVVIQGRTWLVQAKRHASAIRPEHVEAFASLCRTRRMSGLFIHTGRTGPASHSLFESHTHIEIISGKRLLALIHGAPLAIKGVAI